MLVELSRVRVKPGKSARVDEWLAMINERMDEVKQTLVREEMKVEVIFREIIGEDEFLYWFSVQGEAGESVNTSPFEVDQLHIAFHEECIDHDYGMRDAQPQVIMAPDAIAQAIGWPNPPGDAVPFARREIIHRRPTEG
jgi:hypothetical protein